MDKIAIQDLNELFAARTRLSAADAERLVKAMFGIISSELSAGNSVKVRGLGVFKVVDVESRESVDVNTGERVTIEGHGKLSFQPDATLKEIVNRPFSQFETVVLNDGVDFSELDMATTANEEEQSKDHSEGEQMPNEKVEQQPAKEDIVERPAEEGEENAEPIVEEHSAEKDGNGTERILQEDTDRKVGDVVEEKSQETADDDNTAVEAAVDTVAVPLVDAVAQTVGEPEHLDKENISNSESAHNTLEETKEEENKGESIDEHSNERKSHREHEHKSKRESHGSNSWRTSSRELDDDDEYDDDGFRRGQRSRMDTFLCVLLWVVVIGVSGFIGYLYGTNETSINNSVSSICSDLFHSSKTPLSEAVTVPSTPQTVANDSTAKTKDTVKVDMPKETAVPDTAKVEKKKEEKAQEETSKEQQPTDNYASHDVRVRTGAYRIVGTATTVTVGDGATVKSISKQYLGPDMECYVEVYNNINSDTQLRKGQKLKIPKLELKKRRK